MLVQLLQQLLGEFHRKLEAPTVSNAVIRDAVFAEVSDKIKVAIGMRRAGKTMFVFQKIRKLLAAEIPLNRILYINFEDDRLLPLSQEKLADLVTAFYELYPENHEQTCYLFFDEIQNVDDWALVVRRLFDSKAVEIFLTGSSAKLLSKEIASNLRGRSLATEIWPYSFVEFLRANNYQYSKKVFDKKIQDTLSQHFNHYLEVGGFPEVTHYARDYWRQTLQEYIDVVIYRDIIERHEIKNVSVIKHMILFMLSASAASFSVNKFYNDLRTRGYKISKDVLYEYMEHIEDAYLVFTVPLFDESIRKVQTNPKKLYAIDPGLVRAAYFMKQGDLGRLFENIIYLDLRRTGHQIYYYLTKERYEVDFLAIDKEGNKKLFQAVCNMADESIKQREERALIAAQDELNIPGKIITLESYLRDGWQLFE